MELSEVGDLDQSLADADKHRNEVVRKAVFLGDADAQSNLGDIYYYGWGVPQDYAQAAKWYRKAADQGHVMALATVGYMHTEDFNEHREGSGILQDEVEAAIWYRRAAEAGDAHCQFDLGRQYYYGKHVTQDYEEAAEWFRKAADQGDDRAQYRLGVMYEKGWGVLQDYVMAYMLYNLASAGRPRTKQMFIWNKSDSAGKKRDRVAKKMTREQVAEAQKWAREWMERPE